MTQSYRQTSRTPESKRIRLHTKDKKARLDAGFCFIHFSDRRLKSSVACPPLRLLHGGAAGRQEPPQVNVTVCTQKTKKPAQMRAFCLFGFVKVELRRLMNLWKRNKAYGIIRFRGIT